MTIELTKAALDATYAALEKRRKTMEDKYPHTETPWVYHSGAIWKDGPSVYPKGLEDGIPICSMDREPGNGTVPCEGFFAGHKRDSNAKFIVRACNAHDDLVAACREIIAEWEVSSEYRGETAGIIPKTAAVIYAEIALRKAEENH